MKFGGWCMCGVTGFLSKSNTFDWDASVEVMNTTLRHRGPDAGGIWTDQEAGIALAHRRLAILDLSERGAQPMHSACGRYVIVFNGEIYNHLVLRGELEQVDAAIPWRGTSDTETLLAGFMQWGVMRMLQKCVGMFAFALWDKVERRLTLARDRFGEKPLYYGWVAHGAASTFMFGSELKALRAHPAFDNKIDRGAIALFMQFCYVPSPHSIYQNIFKLEPGCVLTLAISDLKSREIRVESYWRYEDVVLAGLANPVRDENEGLTLLEKALREAVGLQLIADVPVGAFLSGGIDSSIIVALMQEQSSRPIKTFTVGFDETAFDEAPYAAKIARHLGTDHCEIRVTPKECLSVIPNLSTMYDEPFGDSSQIPTSIVCATARRSVTVALSGDAGDELFGGYNQYISVPRLARRMAIIPLALQRPLGTVVTQLASSIATPSNGTNLSRLAAEVARYREKAYKLGFALRHSSDPGALYNIIASEWPTEAGPVLAAPVLPTKFGDFGWRDHISHSEHRMMIRDASTYLPDDILTKVDRAAMAVSLETRVPMLDHRIAEVAWRMPLSMKIRDGRGKWALRQILYRHVPRELVERPKAGFAVPIGKWLRGPLRDWAESLLTEERLQSDGYLDASLIRQMWKWHLSSTRNYYAPRIWNVLMFQAWLDAQKCT